MHGTWDLTFIDIFEIFLIKIAHILWLFKEEKIKKNHPFIERKMEICMQMLLV